MRIIEKKAGPKIDYTVTGTVVALGHDELALDMAEIQDDWDIHVNVYYTKKHTMTTGRGGITYVAEFDIPAREYTESEEEGSVPVPLDMEKVTMSLWAIDDGEEENA